ncbi:ATP-dependent RNA helicase rok1 [Teratosphaeria destructans]|uniref:ATP-dependent RNA helicase n=1 Tax=Teratosphaeria destructans TaxID=418781 RepID=A0A9W7W3P4_9PEZI|nr:ATP-dependent RNA helicase rok1 [Teratosphaeria destructans]
MHPFKLLSRSTKLKNTRSKNVQKTPSGAAAQPQIFPPQTTAQGEPTPKKRKRSPNASVSTDNGAGGLDFFDQQDGSRKATKRSSANALATGSFSEEQEDEFEKSGGVGRATAELSLDGRKSILRQHKLKVTWLNPKVPREKEALKGKDKIKAKKAEKPQLFPSPLQTFGELESQYNLSDRIASNISEQGYSVPTEVQLGALPILLDAPGRYLDCATDGTPVVAYRDVDLFSVAPTGSGKTLAFMIPLVHKICHMRQTHKERGSTTTGIVLAPTKELVRQIVNEGRKLANGTTIRITQVRKGMRLPRVTDKDLDQEDQDERGTVVKSDILVSTPGVLYSILESQESEDRAPSTVQYLVLDEADVLLDLLFREQTLGIWNGLTNPELRVSLWSATMGSNIEELARLTIDERRRRLAAQNGSEVDEAPLVRLVVGLKDSAVPNIDHKLIYAATEQGKLMGLRQLLHPSVPSASGPPLRPPFLVFTQTIARAVALYSELLYDIPAEAGGISRIAVLHSDLSDMARDDVMTRFRKGDIWILITTDLLSRGIDFKGVNGVVNYDIPTSSAAYVHRVGRTGRAGREGGVAVTLYSKEDISYLKHIANVVAMAQKHKNGGHSEGMAQWLLDALPSLSKNEKQKLKKHGIEARNRKGTDSNAKAARKARISSKAGFVRKEENRRRGAVEGSRRRIQAQATAADLGIESDFDGFD